MPDPETFTRLVSSSTQDGLPAPALRFGDPRVMAPLSCLCSFTHLSAGLANRSLRDPLAALIPGYDAGQMTYDLRRLRGKGHIRRVPRSHRYELTEQGRRIAVFLTKTYTRILSPGLAELDPRLPADVAALARAWRAYEQRARREDQTGRYRGLIENDQIVKISAAKRDRRGALGRTAAGAVRSRGDLPVRSLAALTRDPGRVRADPRRLRARRRDLLRQRRPRLRAGAPTRRPPDGWRGRPWHATDGVTSGPLACRAVYEPTPQA
jgi:hypothetical protein